ncbi:MAG: pyridoxamine 5'-phosphate oxidase family protein [Acidobacteria bacterium]|nr:pyridoxamine 5'-phosphate oxidase family protein [Acidobacteriota bacterium]
MSRLQKNSLPKSARPYMPGYGLPKGRKGLLPWRWAEQRLGKSHNYWTTTVRPNGSPHTMVVWGLWPNGAFYFSTGHQSRKARNLAENSRCVVYRTADEAVIVEGEARLIKDNPGQQSSLPNTQTSTIGTCRPWRQNPSTSCAPLRGFWIVREEVCGSRNPLEIFLEIPEAL